MSKPTRKRQHKQRGLHGLSDRVQFLSARGQCTLISGTTCSKPTRHRISILVSIRAMARAMGHVQTMVLFLPFFNGTDAELRRFMDVAKLQTPTTRRKAEEKTTLPNSATTVKESDDENVHITSVDVRPSSSGRERFGVGTKLWPKFSLEEGLDDFQRYVSQMIGLVRARARGCNSSLDYVLFFLLHSYLQSVEGGSKGRAAAGQETVDLGKFLKLVDPSTCDLNNVTYMKHIVTYLNKLRECGVGPSGQVTKLTTLVIVPKMGDPKTINQMGRIVYSQCTDILFP